MGIKTGLKYTPVLWSFLTLRTLQKSHLLSFLMSFDDRRENIFVINAHPTLEGVSEIVDWPSID